MNTWLVTQWAEFAASWTCFMLMHSVPVRPRIRSKLVGWLGQVGYGFVYSIVSLGLLYWLIDAASRAPAYEMWPFAPWQLWVPNLLMPMVLGVLCFGAALPNPLSFGGVNNAAFNPQEPGLIGVFRHPILVALFWWSASHFLANNTVAHGIMFGTFAAFSLAGMAIVDRRKQKQMGMPQWEALAAQTSWFAPHALFHTVNRLQGMRFIVRLLLTVFLYCFLFWVHPFVIGVSPFPL